MLSQVHAREDEIDEPAPGHGNIVQYTSRRVDSAGHDEQSGESFDEIA